MAPYGVEGIVLRTRNLGEADRIITLYTRTRGKVEGVARGCRRPRSRLMGATQLFTYGRYTLYPGRSLHTLSQADLIHSFSSLREDLHLLAHASYLAELLDVCVELDDPSEELFRCVLAAFTLLARGVNPELVDRWFEFRIMALLGYRPELDRCVSCFEPAPQQVRMSVREGGVLCPNCWFSDSAAVGVERSTVEWMKQILNLAPDRLGVLRLSAHDLRTVETIARGYVDYRLARPLKSLQFLASMKDLA